MPEPKRIDPPSRPVDGDINDQVRLVGLNPERVYRLASPTCIYSGLPYLRGMGWVQENHRKDGPRFVGGETAKDGDVLTWGDQVLVSRPRAMEEEYERQKAATADRRAQAIGQQGGVDGLRGPTGRLAQFAEDPREYRVRG